ncbi:MAG: hypothetical protein QM831_24675 [Kofleriaceae bacterium]
MRWLLVLVAACRFNFDTRAIDAAPPDAPDLGCADGTREAFVDPVAYPAIAGCQATWTGTANLRGASSGATCGNAVPCVEPADACAPGWHVCGDTGDPGELSARVSATQCATESGHWVTAMGHCSKFGTPSCLYATYGCVDQDVDCSEPVCCGQDCSTENMCKDGVWGEGTRVGGSFDTATGVACGAFDASHTDGVLCCKPSAIDPTGCADGTREAFVDTAKYPEIAGCSGTWSGQLDLRGTGTGAACGNSLGPCAMPADVCSPGWHVCGTTSNPSEVSSRITAQQCLSEPGLWTLAMSHCYTEVGNANCDYSLFPCYADSVSCSEAACCGADCSQGNDCKDGIYPGVTRISGLNDMTTAPNCGAFSSNTSDGLLCCR